MKDLEIKTMEQLMNVCGKNIPNTQIVECKYRGMSYCVGGCYYDNVTKKYEQIVQDRVVIQVERTIVEELFIGGTG